MDYIEKAELILKELEEVININYNFKDMYIKAIVKALKKIERADAE